MRNHEDAAQLTEEGVMKKCLFLLGVVLSWLIVPTANADNLVVNGGFENDSSGWTLSPASPSGFAVLDYPLYVHSGTYAATFGSFTGEDDKI